MKSQLKMASLLVLALVGPPAAIWGATQARSAWTTPASPYYGPVSNFSDYEDPLATDRAGGVAIPGTTLWRGSPGGDERWFRDLAAIDNRVIVMSAWKLVVIDAASGALVGETALGGSLADPVSLTVDSDQQAWLYYPNSGLFAGFDTSRVPTLKAVWRLERALRTPLWLQGRTVVANGRFDDAQLHSYTPMTDGTRRTANNIQGVDPGEMQRVGTGGRLLFYRSIKTFRDALNETRLVASPDGQQVAAVFKWSSRLEVYRVKDLTLERAIAGPTETKLNFGVGTYDKQPVFSLGDESTFNYIDAAATGNAILALYSGREQRHYRGMNSLGATIHVYSWDGVLLDEIQLAQPVSNITLRPNTEELYGIRWRPEPELLRFDLSDRLRGLHLASLGKAAKSAVSKGSAKGSTKETR